MLWEGSGVGAIQVSREPPPPFTDKELALLKTFADQAVIAIQNARLFNETKEALEQQKASAEILSVISGSVADANPVFEKILESCKHLFGGDELDVLLVDDRGCCRWPPTSARRATRWPRPSLRRSASRRRAVRSRSVASCTIPMC